MNPEHNRRAVYAAAAKVFSDRRMQAEILALLDRSHNGNTLHVARFVEDVAEHVGLSATERRSFTLAVFSALDKPTHELSAVPRIFSGEAMLPETQAPDAPAPAATARSLPAQTVVFTACISTLLQQLDRTDRESMPALAEFMTVNADALGIRDAGTRDATTQWAQQGCSPSRIPELTKPATMGEFMNALYVGLCDVVGPVLADRILDRAVSTADELPEAAGFSIRSVL